MNKKHVPKQATRPVAVNSVEADTKTRSSRMDCILGSAENMNYRLQATLNQLTQIEDCLIGTVDSNGSLAAKGVGPDAPFLTLIEIEQATSFGLIDEIGSVLDRISDAVRK